MPDDPRDYIDPDEGYRPNESRAFYTFGEPCENCGTACDSGSLVFVPGWNFNVCPVCAEECRILIFAEENCSVLYQAIERTKSVGEVQECFRQHKESCPNCNPKFKTPVLPVRRSVKPEGAFGTGQMKDKAA